VIDGIGIEIEAPRGRPEDEADEEEAEVLVGGVEVAVTGGVGTVAAIVFGSKAMESGGSVKPAVAVLKGPDLFFF